MKKLLATLIHPYPSYGLAVALLQARKSPEDLTPENTPIFLLQTIEQGLENFRFKTDDNPQTAEVLKYSTIKLKDLLENKNLVQGELSRVGKYLAPTVITTDGDAKGTFENAAKIISLLRDNISLESKYTFSRSFAPTTAKINNGNKSQSPPDGTLFEAACSVIATLTEKKPASLVNLSKKEGKVELRNVTTIPALPLNDLKKFVQLFSEMMTAELQGHLMEVKLTPKKEEGKNSKKKLAKKENESGTETTVVKSEFRRPKIFDGNYPYAPRNTVFGAVGLLAAIGRWGVRANNISWAREVLESIAGTYEKNGHPLYVISYEGIAQVQFTHHIVGLSASGELSEMIDSFARDTRLYADIAGDFPNHYASDLKTSYELFILTVNRFLQLFTQPAFQDFLAMRAEYSSKIEPLFKEYFMEERKINREIVESARVLGQWLNRTAYVVADSEIDQNANDRAKKVRQSKAKILVEFESAAMSATSPQDMLYRISTRAGRLLQRDMPAEATRFLDETMIGDLVKPKDALHLLIAYMRLRTTFEKTENAADSVSQTTQAVDGY